MTRAIQIWISLIAAFSVLNVGLGVIGAIDGQTAFAAFCAFSALTGVALVALLVRHGKELSR